MSISFSFHTVTQNIEMLIYKIKTMIITHTPHHTTHTHTHTHTPHHTHTHTHTPHTLTHHTQHTYTYTHHTHTPATLTHTTHTHTTHTHTTHTTHTHTHTTHTHRICNIYCFSLATMVARTPLNVSTWYGTLTVLLFWGRWWGGERGSLHIQIFVT